MTIYLSIGRRTAVLGCLLATLACHSAIAQTPIFRGDAVTESALINALTLRPSGVKTRGIEWKKDKSAGSVGLLITFKTNSDNVSTQAQKQLDIVAGALQAEELSSYSFVVEGHADPRGPDNVNLTLSQRRAESVVQYLVAIQGIPRNRLNAIGRGESEPMFPGLPSAPENRRVTIRTQAN